MAYYAIGLAILIAVTSSCITYILCMGHLNKSYSKGWDDSKKVYYDDIMKAKKMEKDRIFRELDSENKAGVFPISSELMMAYGVSKVGELPKGVKAYYNINEDQEHIDLDTIMSLEDKSKLHD